MSPTIVPSIAMISLTAMLSLLGAAILRKTWMRIVALGCAGIEIGAVITLLAM